VGPPEVLPAGTRSSRHALGWTNVELFDRYDRLLSKNIQWAEQSRCQRAAVSATVDIGTESRRGRSARQKWRVIK
jgi:hypothetical protein